MLTIGLLGGMSWESSAVYYRVVNEEVRRRLGGTHCARSIMWTVEFAELERFQEAGDWEGAGAVLADAAARLEAAGADMLVLCTNTMHVVSDAIEAATSVPFLHIADVVADAVEADGRRRVGLLGTGYTMEQDFLRDRLSRRHGAEVLVPAAADRALLHRIIYDELVRGIACDESRAAVLEVVARLTERGAEGVILGCTELELLVPAGGDDRLYPSAQLHAVGAVDAALAGVAVDEQDGAP